MMPNNNGITQSGNDRSAIFERLACSLVGPGRGHILHTEGMASKLMNSSLEPEAGPRARLEKQQGNCVADVLIFIAKAASSQI
jgi:hypothetical protein